MVAQCKAIPTTREVSREKKKKSQESNPRNKFNQGVERTVQQKRSTMDDKLKKTYGKVSCFMDQKN